MVSVFPPPCGAMETLRNVQMAVMREVAVSCHVSRIVNLYTPHSMGAFCVTITCMSRVYLHINFLLCIYKASFVFTYLQRIYKGSSLFDYEHSSLFIVQCTLESADSKCRDSADAKYMIIQKSSKTVNIII